MWVIIVSFVVVCIIFGTLLNVVYLVCEWDKHGD